TSRVSTILRVFCLADSHSLQVFISINRYNHAHLGLADQQVLSPPLRALVSAALVSLHPTLLSPLLPSHALL
ncbi:hypothetical protein K474DRAFT_1665263, partial [Panus rudis PR-1116 ss-1]